MRYYSNRDSNILKTASMGPEVIAAKQMEDWRLNALIARSGQNRNVFGNLVAQGFPARSNVQQRFGSLITRQVGRGAVSMNGYPMRHTALNGLVDRRFPGRHTAFGAINSQLVSAGGAAGGAIAGATAGSVVPVVGTAIGMVVGALVGILTQTSNTASHIGTWDATLAQGIQSMPASAAGIGRQIPWNENSHGLVQMIECLLAVGSYMSWDASIKSNYHVCANWATTFGNCVAALVKAIVGNPVNAPVSVSIALAPGGSGTLNFSFVNPGIAVGPDYIAANLIMGMNGLMYAIIIHQGETAAHAQSNAINSLAQKVFALMVDYQASQLVPATPAAPVPIVAPIVSAAATAANQAIISGNQPQAAAVNAALATPYPVATGDGTLIATPTPVQYGTPVPGPAIGYPDVAPVTTAAVVAPATTMIAGIPDWLTIGAVAAAAGYFFLSKKSASSAPATAAV
jgi:hypothetical protein